MKRILIFLLVIISAQAFSQFDKYFENKSLRLDYYHSGNHEISSYSFDKLLEEPFWGGSHINLIDTFEYGNYYVKLFDAESNTLIYSRGYGSIFGEWQTTNESKEISRSMSETVIMPFPKKDARIELYERNWDGIFEKKFEYTFKAKNYFTNEDNKKEYPNFSFHKSGDPSKKVDVVI
ncbi:MAG: peptidase M64, partial [Marinilabiliales bacterium]